jgi:hypothetical protein
MVRMGFQKLFSIVPGGDISPRVPVMINWVLLRKDSPFGGGVYFGGVELITLEERDFEVEIWDGIYVIKGVYHSDPAPTST